MIDIVIYHIIMSTQLSAANLAQSDWPGAYRKQRLYFSEYPNPESGNFLDCFLCGRF